MNIEQRDRELELLHRYVEQIADADLPEVKMILQQYAARNMNRQYKKDTEKATR